MLYFCGCGDVGFVEKLHFGRCFETCAEKCQKKFKNSLLYNSDLQVVDKSVEKFLKKSCKNIWWIMKKAATLQPQNRKVLWLLNATFSGWKSTSHRGFEKKV